MNLIDFYYDFLSLKGQHPDGGTHAKFTNYEFDIDEFLRIVDKAAKHVKYHPLFMKFTNQTVHDEL